MPGPELQELQTNLRNVFLIGSALPVVTYAAHRAMPYFDERTALATAASGLGLCIAASVSLATLKEHIDNQATNGKSDLEITHDFFEDSNMQSTAAIGVGMAIAHTMGENSIYGTPFATALVTSLQYSATLAHRATEKIMARGR